MPVKWGAVLAFLCACCACTGIRVDGFDFGMLFTDVPGSSVQIENKTGVRVVLFKDKVQSQNDALGGIPVGETYGIKQVNGFYLMKVVTEDDLLRNERSPENCVIINTFLIYVDSEQQKFTLPPLVPSPASVYLKNNSQRYVEVRTESFYGDTLTYFLPREERVQYLPYGEYTLWPIYLAVETNGGKVRGITRRFNTENAAAVDALEGSPMQTLVIGSDAVAGQNRDITMYVKNLSATGASFVAGGNIQTSTLNREVINGNGGVQIYIFSEINTTEWLFDANTIYLLGALYESARFGEAMTLNPGDTAYLVYSSGSDFANGTWTRCDTLAEFEAAE